jgi:hypothetical protein
MADNAQQAQGYGAGQAEYQLNAQVFTALAEGRKRTWQVVQGLRGRKGQVLTPEEGAALDAQVALAAQAIADAVAQLAEAIEGAPFAAK